MVPLDEIADPKNDFNLNLPRYIDSTEPEDLQDIDGHLRGGIPERDLDALGALLAGAARRARRPVRAAAPRLPACAAAPEVKPAIFGHPEFTAFNQQATRLFADWRAAVAPAAHRLRQGRPPQGADRNHRRGPARHRFKEAPLLDAYDIYQHLMDYWAETMQDDAT
jgi:type I restriction enzyme M protein